jgi:hypothetical protein
MNEDKSLSEPYPEHDDDQKSHDISGISQCCPELEKKGQSVRRKRLDEEDYL